MIKNPPHKDKWNQQTFSLTHEEKRNTNKLKQNEKAEQTKWKRSFYSEIYVTKLETRRNSKILESSEPIRLNQEEVEKLEQTDC